MNITLKLYANLSPLLPAHAKQNAVQVDIEEQTTVNQLIDAYHVPREQAHLVLVNGVFVGPDARDQVGQLKAGDTIAIWPPVAGG